MNKLSLLGLTCIAASTSACIDLSVPESVTIRCDPDDDATCPDGTVCQPGLLVCVQEEELDDTAPTLTLTLEPALASRTQPLTLRAVSSEALPEPPTGVLVLPDGTERPLDFVSSLSNPDARDYHFEYEADGDEPEDTDVVVRVSAIDRVGLGASAEIVARFDFTPPAALPDDSTQGSLGAVYIVVAPAGTADDDTPVWRLEAPPGTVEAGARVVMRSAANTLPFDEANARVDGSARADIPAGTYELWVSQRDVAGNESPLVRVRELELTMGIIPFAPAGRSLDSAVFARDDVGPLSAGRTPAAYLGAQLRGPMTVARLDRDTPLLADPSLVTDYARGELLLLGGQPLGDDEGSAFSWNGSAWVPRQITVPPRTGHALAFNPSDGSITLLGGSFSYANQEGVPEEWTYDGQLFSREPNDVRPTEGMTVYELRCKHAGAFYDPLRRDVLVVHGCPVTWTAGFETTQWERDPDGEWHFVLSPPDPEGDGNPLALQDVCLAVDHDNQSVLMFGGRERFTEGGPHGETWQWDGTSWARLHAEDPSNTNAPSPRSGSRCAWDPKTGRTYLVGGWDTSGTGDSTRELWAHTDAGWTRLPNLPDETYAEARTVGVDPLRGELVVYHGPRYPIAPNPGFVFDGASWREIPVRTASPSARNDASLVAINGSLVLQGGGNDDVSAWRFDGAWTALGSLENDARASARAVNRNGSFLVLGGNSAESTQVVSVNLASATVPATTLSVSPVAQLPPGTVGWTGHSAAVDPTSGVIAVAGGALYEGFNDFYTDTAVWFLDGATWTRGPELALPSEDTRRVLLTYDESLDAFMLYGNVLEGGRRGTYLLPFTGIASLAGASWQLIAEDVEQPSGAEGGVLLYEGALGAPLLIGGGAQETIDGTTDEAYVFRGDHWVSTPIVDLERDGPLPVLWGLAGAYDAAGARSVLFGGTDGALQDTARTYALDALVDARPALVVTFDTGVTGLSDVESVLALSLDVQAGASGGGVDGAVVRVWDRTRWVELGSVDAPASAPLAANLSAPSEALTHALLGGTVRVQIASRGANGADRARLQVPRFFATARLRTR